MQPKPELESEPSDRVASILGAAPPEASGKGSDFNRPLYFARRGVLHVRGLNDGSEVVLRFRAQAIAQLEALQGRSIEVILKEASESESVRFLRDALIVGAAPFFAQRKEALTQAMVLEWIDNLEDNDLDYSQVYQAVVVAVAGGKPNGAKTHEMLIKELDFAGP